MATDQYLNSIIRKYRATQSRYAFAALYAKQRLVPAVLSWAGENLNQIHFAGSFAKGTAISGAVDLDLFISLRSTTPHDMRTIYCDLLRHIAESGFSPTAQNVSVGIELSFRRMHLHYDLVPAKRRPGVTAYHTLYRRKKDTWMLTNVWKHIKLVRESGRRPEIMATKIWRSLHGLDFPSFYLELSVLRALKGYPWLGRKTKNFLRVLDYLRDEFVSAKVEDPANTNNIISEDLSDADKRKIRSGAEQSLRMVLATQSLERVIW